MDSITTLIVEDEPMLAEIPWTPSSFFPSFQSSASQTNWKVQRSKYASINHS